MHDVCMCFVCVTVSSDCFVTATVVAEWHAMGCGRVCVFVKNFTHHVNIRDLSSVVKVVQSLG